MKISWRLTITFTIAAILPLIVAGIWSSFQVEKALNNLGEQVIYHRAESVARQIELYLDAHPELDLTDAAQLEADAILGEIAVQRVGETGYTAVFDENAITHFHDDPSKVGMDMSTLAESLPEFWAIFEAALDGSRSDGYYDWQENGQIRHKYMSIVAVEGTALRVAATTYIDEFSLPARQLRNQELLILVVVALVAGIVAFVLGWRFSRPIQEMVHTAEEIAGGDLTARPPASGVYELEQLAAAFGRMTANLSTLIRQMGTMSVNLSSAAGQVTMTQRQHTTDSNKQVTAVTDAGVAVEELATSSAHIANTAQQVVDTARHTETNARHGTEIMNETAQRLQRISDGNQAAVAKVRELGTLAREIDMVMDLIEDIAAQTRLIAFNASIEAAAAGEVGRRFAIVASEVRSLAGDVSQATEGIRIKVEEIQTTTNELIIASERESKEIESGLASGGTMSEFLGQIVQSAQGTTVAAEQISLSTQQQRSATEQVLEDLQSLTGGARTVAAGSAQTEAVMDELVTMAQNLSEAVDRFKLPEESPDGDGAE